MSTEGVAAGDAGTVDVGRQALPCHPSRCATPDHWRLGCPRCSGPVDTVSIVCGADSHRTYRCRSFNCGWSGRSGLISGSPKSVHDAASSTEEATDG